MNKKSAMKAGEPSRRQNPQGPLQMMPWRKWMRKEILEMKSGTMQNNNKKILLKENTSLNHNLLSGIF